MGRQITKRYNSVHPNTRLKWQHPNRYFCLIWNVKDLAVCSTFEEVLASSAKVQANSNKEAVYVWPGEYYSQLLYHSRGLKCITYQKKKIVYSSRKRFYLPNLWFVGQLAINEIEQDFRPWNSDVGNGECLRSSEFSVLPTTLPIIDQNIILTP